MSLKLHKIVLGLEKEQLSISPKQTLSYFYCSLILGLIILPTLAFLKIPSAGMILTAFSIMFIISRFSIVFPSIAAGEKLTFSESWNITKPYQKELFLTCGVFAIVSYAISHILETYISIQLLTSIIDLILFIFNISIMTVAYKAIINNRMKSG